MLNVPYPTTMRAAEPTELFLIHRDGFQLLLNNHPHLLEVISQAMGDRQDVLESYRHHLEVAGLLEDSEPKSLMARFQNQLRQWVRHWSP
jgi:CRP-like cAMP-binding protein